MEREQHPKTSCTIAVVGKYVQLQDAYLSITEALRHGGIGWDARVHIQYVDAETVTEDNAAQLLAGAQGILIPGGFGNRLGGTLRLGAYPCAIQPGTLAHRLYGKPEILERHRHRYEFNNQYRQAFQKAGMVFSGINPQRDLVEIAELPDYPFFIGVQFHPEFQSRPDRPHPLFLGFVGAALAYGQRG